MDLMSYLNEFALVVLLSYLIFFYLFYPLLILISIHDGIGFKRHFRFWLRSDKIKWLSKSFIIVTVIGIILNHVLYLRLFTYFTDDSLIFYFLLFTIGSLISASIGSFVHPTLGYFAGSYGTGTALILYGILRPSSLIIENSGFLYLIVVLLSLYAGVIAGRLSRGIINYGFTVSTIDICFNNISPKLLDDLETDVLSVYENIFNKPFFDNIEPYNTHKHILHENRIIFESGVDRSVYGDALQKNSVHSFNVEFVNKIMPNWIFFKKIWSNEKQISRQFIKISAEDVESNDFVYHKNRYYKILSKKTENDSIEIKIEDILSNKKESLELRKENPIYLSVKFVPEMMDTVLNTFAYVNSKVFVDIDFLKKSVHFIILTDERTSTRKYVTPYSFERAFQVHDLLVKKFENDNVNRIKTNGPFRIYNYKERSYLDFESNFIANLDITSLNLNDEKIKLINSIPKSYLDNSCFDVWRTKIYTKVFVTTISSMITTSFGLVIRTIL